MRIYNEFSSIDYGMKLPVYPCYLSYNDNLPEWSYVLHCHADTYECAFIIKDVGYLKLENAKYRLLPGDIVVIPPEVRHTYVSDKNSAMRYYSLRYYVKKEEEESDTFLRRIKEIPSIIHANEQLNFLTETFSLLEQSLSSNQGHATDLSIALCISLYYLAASNADQGTVPLFAKKSTYAHEILDYISQHFNEKITLELLAKEFNLSPSHLSKVFRDAYQVSPIAYLISVC